MTQKAGEGGRTNGPATLDIDHLTRQTMGDVALAREVLALFSQQLATLGDEMAKADHAERRRLAHGLKGSARGVGAFALADWAAEIEREPASEVLQARLDGLAREVEAAIARIAEPGTGGSNRRG